MIVIDSSAIVAILLDEPERHGFALTIASRQSRMSALNAFETETVIRRRLGHDRVASVRLFLTENRVVLEPFDDVQATEANAAYAHFGKGVHPARLNLCDCAAYALARSLNAPLLYKGDDFALTDIASAIPLDPAAKS